MKIEKYWQPSSFKMESVENYEDIKTSSHSSGNVSPEDNVDSDRQLENDLPKLFEKLNVIAEAQDKYTRNPVTILDSSEEKPEFNVQCEEKLAQHFEKFNITEISQHEGTEDKLSEKGDNNDKIVHQMGFETSDLLERGGTEKGSARRHPYLRQRTSAILRSAAQEVEEDCTVNSKLCDGGTTSGPKSDLHVLIHKTKSVLPIVSQGIIMPVMVPLVPKPLQSNGMNLTQISPIRDIPNASSSSDVSSAEENCSDFLNTYSNDATPKSNHLDDLDVESYLSDCPLSPNTYQELESKLCPNIGQSLYDWDIDKLFHHNDAPYEEPNKSSSQGSSSGTSSLQPSTAQSSPIPCELPFNITAVNNMSLATDTCQTIRKLRPLLPKVSPPAVASEPVRNVLSAKERIKQKFDQTNNSFYHADVMKEIEAEITKLNYTFIYSSLMESISDEDYGLIYFLVERLKSIPGDMTYRGDQFMNALELAVYEKKALIARYLTETMDSIGVAVNSKQQNGGNTLIHRLCTDVDGYGGEYSEVLEELLRVKNKNGGKVFDVNEKNNQGYTPLHVASRASKRDKSLIRTLEVLMTNGSDPQIKEDSSGKTALFLAIESQNLEFIQKMLETTSNPKSLLSKDDNHGNLAMHIAASSNELNSSTFQKLIELLLQYGAEHNMRNAYNQFPKALASSEHKDVFIKAVKQAEKLRSVCSSV